MLLEIWIIEGNKQHKIKEHKILKENYLTDFLC